MFAGFWKTFVEEGMGIVPLVQISVSSVWQVSFRYSKVLARSFSKWRWSVCSYSILQLQCKEALVVRQQRQNIDMEALNLETLLQAANYLDIKGLLDVTCKTVANMIKGKTPEEIRKTFNIKNDFTEEEEAQVLDLGLIII